MSLEDLLDQVAEKILTLDETALTELLPQYKSKMEDFQPSKEWEKAVVIFFIINSVRVKNSLFNDNTQPTDDKKPRENTPGLKLVKS
jgi:hypothetical protein